jgi:hypothetical protein
MVGQIRVAVQTRAVAGERNEMPQTPLPCGRGPVSTILGRVGRPTWEEYISELHRRVWRSGRH